MRFEFARERRDPPVKLLPRLEIPRLAELQGRNGIGKSLSVKLLQLLTGEQPWTAEPEAWRTLRDRLGPASVSGTGMANGRIIEWDLNPALWPVEPPTNVGDLYAPTDRGAGIEVQIDGVPASLPEVRALLLVRRLVGDETLEDSVRLQIDQLRDQAASESGALAAVALSVREAIAEAVETLEPLSGRTIRRLSAELDALGVQRTELSERRATAAKRSARIFTLETRARTIEQLSVLASEGDEGELSATLARIDAKIAEVRAERDRRFEAAIADASLRQQVEEARAEVERVEGLLLKANDDAAREASKAGLVLEGVDSAADAAVELHDEVTRQIEQLRERQADQDAVPMVTAAATTVKRALDRVKPSSLLEHPFATLPQGEVSGQALAEGIEAQLGKLARTARSVTGQEIESEARAASARLEAVTELQRALARQRRHTTTLKNRRDDLLALTGQADGASSAEYSKLEEELAALEDERRELQGTKFRYDVLADELQPGETLDEARDRLVGDIRAAGVVAIADLAETRAALDAEGRDLDFQLRSLEVEGEGTLRALESARERQAFSRESVTRNGLMQSLDTLGVSPPPHGDAEALESFASDLLKAAEEALSRLDELSLTTDGLVGAFPFLEVEIPADRDGRLIEHVRATAEEDVVSSLNQPVLREELFDGGEVLGYDHKRKTVSFLPPESPAPVSRSLSAFSSGERVFAYTQMRLRAIADDGAACENRIVVLDEFGAFLEARRIRALEGLVRDELLGRGIDRVLFVLPLSSSENPSDSGYVVHDRSAP